MVRFLSDEWLAELNGAVAFDDHLHEAASGLRLTIQQVVTRPENSERCYTIEIDDGRVRLSAGRIESADATITEDYDTAAALARGETTPQDAILAGRIRVSGDLGALLKGQEVLELVRARFDDVRSRTEY